jgi:tRNA A-37 threonylcarbamoyl transferase component Bud32/dienelactone hydrolase
MSELQDRTTEVLSQLYAVERELGRGGMATVYLAVDQKHHRRVAVKVLHPELAAAVGSERFLREINIEANLQHPHIVPLLDSGEMDGLLFYVMPFVEGESLRQRLSRQGRLDVAEAMRYWRDVIDGIAHAHRQHVLHRDIKPENVLIAERHASVVDFGVGKALGDTDTSETLTKLGLVVGTPVYMAPEQAVAGEVVDQRADVYALGILAYEMLCGHPPFASLTPAAQFATKATAPAPNVRVERSDVPAEVAALVQRCLEPDPKHRWQTADELLAALESIATPGAGIPSPQLAGTAGRGRRTRVAITAAVIVVAAGVSAMALSRSREQAWARDVGLPQLRRMSAISLVGTSPSDSAFVVGQRVRAALASNTEVDSLWRSISAKATLHTRPEGARVYWTAYRGDTAEWRYVGTTPIDSVALPVGRLSVVLLLKFERPGYRTAVRPLAIERAAKLPTVLDSVGAPDSDMVHVRGGNAVVPSASHPSGDTVEYSDFLIDRFEVRNRQFKAFVAAGGYQRRELWDLPFRDEAGVEHSWDEVMSTLRDKTGRPGPASWEAGDIPAGKEDYPVSGISWYEASAFARFAHKELPSIYHWRRAAQVTDGLWIVPQSNMQAASLAPVGAFKGMSSFGAFDMAGNVREWCSNPDGGRRYVLGGSFHEAGYIFGESHTADPLDRSEGNGVRLIRVLAPDTSRAIWRALSVNAPRGFRDYSRERPVADAIFRTFLPLFDYDKTPLNARVLKTDSADARFVAQTIEFDAPYGQERMRAFFYLPRNVAPPYKTVVFFPGSSALDSRSSAPGLIPDYVVTTGRAVLYPIYKDTYDRKMESVSYAVDPVYNMSGGLLGPTTYRDHTIMQVKDLRRSVDYLFTRPDVDTASLAYLGVSWGGRLASINLSVEKRFKVAVLHLPGLMFAPRRPEVDELNYLPHVTVPTLILSGRFDNTFPFESAAMPFVRMLGVPPALKRQQVYPTHHYLPRDEMIRETLDWLDAYQGKVGASKP